MSFRAAQKCTLRAKFPNYSPVFGFDFTHEKRSGVQINKFFKDGWSYINVSAR